MKFLMVPLACALAACSSGGGTGTVGTPTPTPTPSPSPTRPTVASLEATGAIPTLDRSTSLAGPDADNNGVRDDVDAFIAAKTATAEQKRAMVQTAKALQTTIVLPSTNREAALTASLEVTRGLNCLFSRYATNVGEAGRNAEELESVTTNTKPRLQAYLAYNKLTDGSVASLPEGDTCA